jgi:hypothetical protein
LRGAWMKRSLCNPLLQQEEAFLPCSNNLDQKIKINIRNANIFGQITHHQLGLYNSELPLAQVIFALKLHCHAKLVQYLCQKITRHELFAITHNELIAQSF